jgi:nuclear transport factor 2 (NTF2) superfamily protein
MSNDRPQHPASQTAKRPIPLVPPFTRETALAKVKAAESAWNSRDPERVALAYSEDSEWRNRDEFFRGRDAIRAFLRRKWAHELDYRLMKEMWCFADSRISVRLSTNGTTQPTNGSARTATSIGSSRPTA